MKNKLSRRDFLKIAGLFPLAYFGPKYFLKPTQSLNDPEAKNIIIIVLDALTAHNMPLHGYQRDTMPFLSSLADKATVYHNHYSGGNFTTPGTASLLTGTYPWTNRGYKSGVALKDEFVNKNIFSLFDQYYRITYSHNPLVNTLQNQFMGDLDYYLHRRELYLTSDDLVGTVFVNDEDLATVSWVRGMKKRDGYGYSLFLSEAYESSRNESFKYLEKLFPRGIPYISEDSYYLLEDAIDWTISELVKTPNPFLGYFHYLPPHKPYFTRKEFVNIFKNDGLEPIVKDHPLKKSNFNFMNQQRWYDEFILYADAEFHRFYKSLEASGFLENSWVILTSDHGEMFERGVQGHMTELLNDPLVRIPLVIFEPGQQTRKDIYSRTSSVDVLPTLLKITRQNIPEWCEGEVLPPYRDSEPNPTRSIYALEAKKNDQYQPITNGTGMIIKEQFKMIHYFGFETFKEGEAKYELFDLENDPEEMNNLSKANLNKTIEMINELKATMEEADKPYT